MQPAHLNWFITWLLLLRLRTFSPRWEMVSPPEIGKEGFAFLKSGAATAVQERRLHQRRPSLNWEKSESCQEFKWGLPGREAEADFWLRLGRAFAHPFPRLLNHLFIQFLKHNVIKAITKLAITLACLYSSGFSTLSLSRASQTLATPSIWPTNNGKNRRDPQFQTFTFSSEPTLLGRYRQNLLARARCQN